MKKVVLGLLLMVSTASFAQTGIKQDIDVIQSIWGKTKQEVIKEAMELKGTESSNFWKIYDLYEGERKLIGEKRLRLINDYVENYETLTAGKADALVTAIINNNIATEKLYAKYYPKLKVAVGAINATKFLQIEAALQTAIKAETQDIIPFIGEIERTKKQ
jgi:hypothetical protein